MQVWNCQNAAQHLTERDKSSKANYGVIDMHDLIGKDLLITEMHANLTGWGLMG